MIKLGASSFSIIASSAEATKENGYPEEAIGQHCIIITILHTFDSDDHFYGYQKLVIRYINKVMHRFIYYSKPESWF